MRPESISVPEDHFNITPSDTNKFKPPIRAVVVGGSGTVVLTSSKGNDATYTVVPGQYIFGLFTKVKATGTTATNLVGQF